MATATFRFYEELNDFLPKNRRRRTFVYSSAEDATVKQVVESLGVPHTEIEVILVNGESVGFSHRVEEGDRVSAFPMFESLDVRPILRLRAKPLRDTRFVADAHLGRLARYLRMLGFDTSYDSTLSDRELVTISCNERRVLLTRDRELLMHRALRHGIFVRGDRPREQLEYVMRRLDLRDTLRPFTRCMSCNRLLEPIHRDLVLGRVPPRVSDRHREFRHCPQCGRIYWRGTHWRRMKTMVESAMGSRRSVDRSP